MQIASCSSFSSMLTEPTFCDQVKAAGKREADARASAEQLDDAGFIPNKALPFIKQAADSTVDGLHKPIGLVLASAYILGTACHLSGAQVTFL